MDWTTKPKKPSQPSTASCQPHALLCPGPTTNLELVEEGVPDDTVHCDGGIEIVVGHFQEVGDEGEDHFKVAALFGCQMARRLVVRVVEVAGHGWVRQAGTTRWVSVGGHP